MSVAIEVDSLSKKYRLGEHQAAYGTLRESLVHAARRVSGREHVRQVLCEVLEGKRSLRVANARSDSPLELQAHAEGGQAGP